MFGSVSDARTALHAETAQADLYPLPRLGQALDGYRSLQIRVASAIHLIHPTGADLRGISCGPRRVPLLPTPIPNLHVAIAHIGWGLLEKLGSGIGDRGSGIGVEMNVQLRVDAASSPAVTSARMSSTASQPTLNRMRPSLTASPPQRARRSAME